MDRWSAASVARELGTNVPRLMRAGDRLGLHPSRSPGGHQRFDSGDVARLATELGVTPKIGGLRRTQVQVLATLARAPLGLRSRRARERPKSPTRTTSTRGGPS
ncbi:MAG: hypothetical protein M3460_03370 [Actinomycetota bacterium]|nr:hypothetical protein [Actinomycetota bacterium]